MNTPHPQSAVRGTAHPVSTWFRSLHCLSFRLLLLAVLAGAAPSVLAESYTLFESGQVRPMAMSQNGKTLFVLNTPDSRLDAFSIKKKGLKYRGSVLVGLEPVALAVGDDGDVWVVNHVSDSVSIVDASNLRKMRVKRTLLVGDEPRDIVFAGKHRRRAFITTAHRGQNSPNDPQLTTPGVGRADVWVFDREHLGNSMGGDPETIITLFTDTPRALTVSPDGSKVYAAGFETGNQTTVIFDTTVSTHGGLPDAVVNVDMNGDGFAEPHEVNTAGEVQPSTSLIVKFDGQHWRDNIGRIWDDQVKFNLPDKDVFVIDAMAETPVQVGGSSGYYAHVGTILFNMITNPKTGAVYVSNLEAFNQVRFEGPGGGGSTVRGHNVESRITVLDGSAVKPIHLNKHIDRSTCCKPIPNDENAKSLAFPTGMAISSDGKTLYVAALGSSKIGIYDTEALENNSFTPDLANQIVVSGGGPSGVVLDEEHNRLYVLTRFDDGISVIDLAKRAEVDHVAMHSPEPASITRGRRYLYDASFTSSSGDQACAGCHIFGDFDSLAWDLGNPDASDKYNPGPLKINHADFGLQLDPNFKPMKGPMTTQSMRGLANHGPEHWRGDRTGGAPGVVNQQPDGGSFSEDAAFKQFNGAFVTLVGRDQPIPDSAMQDFTDFAMQITYPPNPIRALDNSLTPDQQAGHDFFFDQSKVVDSVFNCNGCHVLDRNANAGLTNKPGFFGTDGSYTYAFQPQFFKVPQLRNLYQKVGKFGMSNSGYFLADDPFSGDVFMNPNQFMGDQIRGFGFLHDGSVDTIFRFHNIEGFLPRPAGTVTPQDPGNPPNLPITPEGMELRRKLEQYLLAFDSNLFPIVGQQVTLNADTAAAVAARIDLMKQRAQRGECDLIASTLERGYLYTGDGYFISSLSTESPIQDADLRALGLKNKNEVTYTCTPPGNGMRLALDQDEDGFFNTDEIQAGSDPASAASVPQP